MWAFSLILVIIFELFADVLSKKWSLVPKLSLLIGGILFYMAANIAWLFALRQGAGLAKGVSIFSVSGAIIAVVLGYWFFEEEFTKIQLAGVILGIVSLVLLFWYDIF